MTGRAQLQAHGFIRGSLTRRNIAKGTRTEGIKGVVTPEHPMDALREALVNMVAHRDYHSRDACQVINPRINPWACRSNFMRLPPQDGRP